MTSKTTSIGQGPSREELFDALRLRSEGRKVKFFIRSENVNTFTFLEVRVLGIEIPRDSIFGENNWELKLLDQSSELGSRLLKAYYSTDRREGVIQPINHPNQMWTLKGMRYFSGCEKKEGYSYPLDDNFDSQESAEEGARRQLINHDEVFVVRPDKTWYHFVG